MERFYQQYISATRSIDGYRRPATGKRVRATVPDSAMRWSGSKQKRVFDFVFALIALLLLSPIMLAAAVAVKLSSRGPVLFKQERMGKGGREFIIYKFRTMRVQKHGAGPEVTRKGDSRLTSIGAFLRRFKIDELPQLYNVLKGDMSVVGVRPKVRRHQIYPLHFRPGITGAASLAFREEETLLQQVTHDALDEYQIYVMMPLKKQVDESYMQNATFVSDLKIIFATVFGRGERLDAFQLRHFQESLFSLDLALRVRFAPGTHSESERYAEILADAA